MDLLTRDPPARLFTFAETLTPAKSGQVASWQADGNSTDIAEALKSLDRYLPADNIQAVLLLSDGNHLGKQNPAETAAALSRPVYCLGVGSADTPNGTARLALALPDPPVKMIAQAENSVSLELSWQSLRPTEVNLAVVVNGRKADPRSVPLTTPAGRRKLEVKIKPEAAGKTVCNLQLAGPSGEGATADNTREFHSLALPEKIRVLMVEGQIRPEYKFLKQYLQSDPAVTFAGFVQVRPGKFLVTSQIPGYQPKELPATKAEFEKFDLVILGDISPRTLNAPQIQCLKELVTGGRGLLLIAGEETGELATTALAELLPVKLAPKTAWLDPPFLPRLTLAGKTHPALKGLEPFFQKDARLHGAFQVGTRSRRPPPSWPIRAAPPPRRSAGRQGQIRLLAAESTWRWALNPSPVLRNRLYKAFWGQIIRDLANRDFTAKQSPELLVNTDASTVQAGRPLKIAPISSTTPPNPSPPPPFPPNS